MSVGDDWRSTHTTGLIHKWATDDGVGDSCRHERHTRGKVGACVCVYVWVILFRVQDRRKATAIAIAGAYVKALAKYRWCSC